MQYAFVLGRVYTLSLAELFEKLQTIDKAIKILDASSEVLVIETETTINIDKLQRELGGVIKILKVIEVIKKRENDSINFALRNYFKPSILKKDYLKNYTGKIQFGVSVYLLDPAIQAFGEPKRIGMFIKRAMQDGGASIRVVVPEYNSLSLASVVVTKNLLLQKGAEIAIIGGKDRVYVTKTLAVQDFEDYGRRDYQRPIRDEKQGMIPPKVAQVMLNLCRAKPGETVLDPFCGIGTLLQEGVLLGYKMLGSDISSGAVAGSEKNLEWFRNRYKISPGKYHVETFDAREVSKLVDTLSQVKAISGVAAIVTEGYLGPLYGQYPKEREIEANFEELKQLYTESFQELLKFLPEKGRVVICIPAYKKNQTDYKAMENLDFITSLGYNQVDLIPASLAKNFKFLRITPRKTAIYDRKDQTVAREIVIFEKK